MTLLLHSTGTTLYGDTFPSAVFSSAHHAVSIVAVAFLFAVVFASYHRKLQTPLFLPHATFLILLPSRVDEHSN